MMNRGNTGLARASRNYAWRAGPLPPNYPPGAAALLFPKVAVGPPAPLSPQRTRYSPGIPGFVSSLVEGNDPGSGTGPTAVDLATAAARSCPIGLQ